MWTPYYILNIEKHLQNSDTDTDRVRPALEYQAGNWNGTGIPVLVNQKWNGFQEFQFRLLRTGYEV